MADLPVLAWTSSANNLELERGVEREVASLGVVTLDAWADRWQVEWQEDFASGDATSLADAKEKARQFARVLLRQVYAQLDRVLDPVTGLVVQVSDDSEARHG